MAFKQSGVRGADDVVAKFKEVFKQLDPKQQGTKVLRPAIKRASKPLAEQIEKNASKFGKYSTGNIADNVVITADIKKFRRRGRSMVFVGIKKKGTISLGSIKGKTNTHYAYFLEYGTGRHFTNNPSRYAKGEESPRHMKPQPFIRPAIEAQRKATFSSLNNELTKQVNSVIKKLSSGKLKGNGGK